MVSEKGTKRLTSILIAVMALSVLAVFSLGQTVEPTGPDTLQEISDSRYNTTGPLQNEAQAGNVTELNVTAQSATKAWQGYYGNITGTITLEDSAGSVFYDWSAAEPEGEIYASTNNSITWDQVKCFNFTADGTTEPNRSTEESRYGIDENDVDGIDETYTGKGHDTFYVGTNQQSSCPTTYAYQNSASQSSNFQNVLLSDPDTDSLIFTTLLENRDAQNDTDLQGYNGIKYDFQMLVAEDEHTSSAAGSTTYYFWVEIE